MRMRSVVMYAVLLVIGGMFAISPELQGAGRIEHKEEIEKSSPFISNGEIRIESRNGAIDVQSWDREEVKVTYALTIRAQSEEIAMDIREDIGFILERDGNRMEIYAELPSLDKFKTGGFLGGLFGGKRPGVSILITAYVPYRSSVEARSSNGRISLDKLDGNVDLQTSNGSIQVGPVSGDAVLHTSNGKIIAQEVSGGINAKTSNGAITVVMDTEGTAEDKITCRTSNGGISLKIPKFIKTDIDARTSNGSIIAELYQELDADLHLTTSRGSIKSDIPLTPAGTKNKRDIKATLGKGGNKIRLRTSNGSISLKRLE